MQSVSAEYLAAITAPTRKIVSRVEIAFLDNSMLQGVVSAAADELDATHNPVELVIDTLDKCKKRLAFADPHLGAARVLPGTADDPLYPMTSEGGWWGNTHSDDDGYISGGETVTLTFSLAQIIRAVRFGADSRLGYPVDFTMEYWTGSAWIEIVDVSGNTLTEYLYQMPAAATTTKARITITRVSHGRSYAKLLEFEVGQIEDMSARVQTWEILKEREAEGSQPVGNASMNSASIVLDNTDRAFYRKSGSAYAPYLVENRRIRVWCGVVLADGVTEETLAQGTFYSRDWEADEGSPTARVTAWDRAKRMSEEEYSTSQVVEGQTHAELATLLGSDYGLQVYEMAIDPAADDVVPYGWFEAASYWSHLKALATGQGGAVYFDELDRLVFESREYLAGKTTSVATLTDLNAIFGIGEEWRQENKRNSVIVPVRPLTLAAALEEICNLAETITVPAGGTKSVTLFFSKSPCMNIQTPAITGGAHISIQSWSAYAWGGDLALANSAGSDETVTLITVQAKPLEELGGVRALAEDATDIVQSGGRRVYVLPDDGARFVQRLAVGEALAAGLLAALLDPGNRPPVRARGRPELQLGDRVTLQDSRLGYNGYYWLNRIRLAYDGGLTMEITPLEVT
jgi:hypothetical protein